MFLDDLGKWLHSMRDFGFCPNFESFEPYDGCQSFEI